MPASGAPERHNARIVAAIALLGGLLATFLRWYFVTHAQVLQPLDDPHVRADAAEYYRYAWNVLHHATFSAALPGADTHLADSFRDPGYPVFLALWMSITPSYDAWYAAVLVSQAVLGGVTVACLALSMGRMLSWPTLASATLVLACWPHAISIPAYVLSENLLAPLCALAILLITQSATRPRAWKFALTGMVLAAAGLTNAVVAPFIIPLGAALFWKRLVSRRHLVILLVATLLPLMAWGMRNAMLPEGRSAAYRAEMNFVQGSWPTYHAAYQLWAHGDATGQQTLHAIDAETEALHEDPQNGLRSIVARMSHAPGTYLAWYLGKPALLWGWDIRMGQGDIYVYPTRNSPFIGNAGWKAMEAVAFMLNPFLAILALTGAILTLLRREPTAAAVGFTVLTAWVTVVYAVLQSEPRYAIPFRAAEIALAALALSAGAQRLRRKAIPEPHHTLA
jgi:hypothetical protein